MLSRIQVRNLAIVTNLEVEFQAGMSVLSGETGAGKSILIDALGLVLGDRADNGMIQTDADRAEISALFALRECPQARQWLESNSLDDGDECILRRVLVRDGSSRAFINGSPVPARSLRELGQLLLDIHGQHAHQSLLHREQQRELLDAYAGNGELCTGTARSYRAWQRSVQQLETARRNTRDRVERLDLLQYQIDELTRLKLVEGELQALEQELRRLGNAGELQRHCASILDSLYDNEASAHTLLSLNINELYNILNIEPSLLECHEMLESAEIQIGEAAATLRQYAEAIELNPARLEQVEQRLEVIHDLARKYRCRPEELNTYLEQLVQELEQLNAADTRLAELEQQTEVLEQSYRSTAGQLSSRRQQAASRLGNEVTSAIHTLGMPDGNVAVQLHSLEAGTTSAGGQERVEFLVSANPGQPLRPLAKVASGGELSRISLAIQVATINCGQVPTLIFDEVDVGIGGGIAEVVGRLLRRLGEERQILCVTHLPQVAAQGHNHLLISKASNGERVETGITPLGESRRIQEIARMLGGVKITASTLAHAREMLELSAVESQEPARE